MQLAQYFHSVVLSLKILIFLKPDLTETLFSLLLMIEIKFHFLILLALPSVLHPWLKVRKHWFSAEILFLILLAFQYPPKGRFLEGKILIESVKIDENTGPHANR